jgi:hypothetical protein
MDSEPASIQIWVPTVISHGGVAHVEIRYADQIERLDAAQATALAGWMRLCGRWLRDARADQIAEAIERALAHLARHPPVEVGWKGFGHVVAASEIGEPRWIRCDLETAVYESSEPRVVLNLADEPQLLGAGDSWWLSTNEARALAGLLAGTAGELRDGERTWLNVSIEGAAVVRLAFDDDLVRQSGDDGVYRLERSAAQRLAEILITAAGETETSPPHIYAAPEPEPILIAET